MVAKDHRTLLWPAKHGPAALEAEQLDQAHLLELAGTQPDLLLALRQCGRGGRGRKLSLLGLGGERRDFRLPRGLDFAHFRMFHASAGVAVLRRGGGGRERLSRLNEFLFFRLPSASAPHSHTVQADLRDVAVDMNFGTARFLSISRTQMLAYSVHLKQKYLNGVVFDESGATVRRISSALGAKAWPTHGGKQFDPCVHWVVEVECRPNADGRRMLYQTLIFDSAENQLYANNCYGPNCTTMSYEVLLHRSPPDSADPGELAVFNFFNLARVVVHCSSNSELHSSTPSNPLDKVVHSRALSAHFDPHGMRWVFHAARPEFCLALGGGAAEPRQLVKDRAAAPLLRKAGPVSRHPLALRQLTRAGVPSLQRLAWLALRRAPSALLPARSLPQHLRGAFREPIFDTHPSKPPTSLIQRLRSLVHKLL